MQPLFAKKTEERRENSELHGGKPEKTFRLTAKTAKALGLSGRK
jgi:hypothetical protein